MALWLTQRGKAPWVAVGPGDSTRNDEEFFGVGKHAYTESSNDVAMED